MLQFRRTFKSQDVARAAKPYDRFPVRVCDVQVFNPHVRVAVFGADDFDIVERRRRIFLHEFNVMRVDRYRARAISCQHVNTFVIFRDCFAAVKNSFGRNYFTFGRSDFPFRPGAVEQTFAVILRANHNVVNRRHARIEFLLQRSAIFVGVRVVGGVNGKLFHVVEQLNNLVDTTFGNFDHRRAVLNVLVVLQETANLFAHLFGYGETCRVVVLCTDNPHARRDTRQSFARLGDVFVEFAERQLCARVVHGLHSHDNHLRVGKPKKPFAVTVAALVMLLLVRIHNIKKIPRRNFRRRINFLRADDSFNSFCEVHG